MAQDETYFRTLTDAGLKHALADIQQALEFSTGNAEAENKYADQQHCCLAVIRERQGKSHTCQCGRCKENQQKIDQVGALLAKMNLNANLPLQQLLGFVREVKAVIAAPVARAPIDKVIVRP